MEQLRFPEDVDPKILDIHAYWSAKCGGRPHPRRADIDPVEIPRLMPLVTFVDVRPAPPRFVFRLVGTEVVRLFQHDSTGQPVGYGVKPDELADVLGRFERVADRGECVYHRTRMQRESNDFTTVDRVMLPLGPGPGPVDIVLSLVTRVRTGG